jgi:hypothetical protein
LDFFSTQKDRYGSNRRRFSKGSKGLSLLESIINIKKRRRKFLGSPRLNKNMPKAWAYKEFEIEKLFEKINTIPLEYKVNNLPKDANSEYNLPALTAGVINQGLSCFVKRNESCTTILKNVISVSANGANSGAMFYQDCEFTVLQDAYAIKYKSKELNKNESLYFLSALQKVIKGNFNWVNKAGWNKIKNYYISLPITENGDIDFEFMETYISELERERISELDAYLEVTGLNNTILSEDEKQIKSFYCNKTFKQYKIGELFEKVNLRFLKDKFDKSKDISKERTQEFNLPLVNAKDGNNGIMYYGREEDFESTELSIDIVND